MKEYIVPFADNADMDRFEALFGTNGEIIRCKDCGSAGMKNDYDCFCYILDRWNSVNFYCGYAERKE